MDRLAEIAQTADELNVVAAYYLWQHRPQEAAQFATRACERARGCWECFHNHALIRHALGDDAGAAALEETALGSLSERETSYQVRIVESALEAYRTPAPPPDPAKPPARKPKIPLILPE